MSSLDHPHVIRRVRFGEFEVDLGAGELRRNGSGVRIQEQPFRILALLLERPGEIVTRDELRQRLWPSEFVDFDHSLNAAIRKLRETLGDSADQPRFVETLARRGYRLIAPVTEVAAHRRSWKWLAAAAVAIVASLAGVFGFRSAAAPRTRTIHAVAVLPFTTEVVQAQQVADGLTESVIDSLTSKSPEVRVMPRVSVFGYQGSKLDPWRIGFNLQCDTVVLGQVRPENDAYSVRIELIRVRDGAQLWGNRFEAHTTAELSSRISDALAEQLRR